MSLFLRYTLTGLLLVVLNTSDAREIPIRAATYNAQWLDTDFTKEVGRLPRLREVIRRLDANLIGLQEVADRQALEQVFDPRQWSLLIDEDSRDAQDLALAVKRPLFLSGPDGKPRDRLDADDADFLFTGRANDSAFPNRRDVLFADIRMTGEPWTLRVFVHHAKSRRGGRATTEHRRIEASQLILKELKRLQAGTLFLFLGDFNDNPDDPSLNILESGNPSASAEMEERNGPFLVNLAEPLVAQDRVSQGRSQRDIQGTRINTVDPGSREANIRTRGTDGKGSWDFLPDQILIPVSMLNRCPLGSARIFDEAVAIEGDNASRASDHLPVYVDLILGKN